MFLPRRFEKKIWLSNLRFWANLMNVISDIGCVHPIRYLFVFVRLKSSLRKCYGGHIELYISKITHGLFAPSYYKSVPLPHARQFMSWLIHSVTPRGFMCSRGYEMFILYEYLGSHPDF